ncbi:P-loop NTPase [Shewanella surugensis]|uniref:SIR2 family protein n=1 Tax=Shewanella surugensis TaxID=212020 RepID=A0ABT0L771_9GAMM|nr:SIR2 family protein [Shewanella surugensis]MCL1123544.1 SIR2 family protein [Shewanella surugensis]
MNENIKQSLLRGRLVLLLGAGASYGSKMSNGKDIPLGLETAKILADMIGEKYCQEPLSDVYNVVKETIGEHQLHTKMESLFKHITPTKNYIEILKYPFFRIYSLNIDDAMENAKTHNRGLKFNVRLRNDKIIEPDQLYRTIDYIKLNGDINRVTDGFIFSSQEYAKGSAKAPLWYEEVARDFTKYTFLFIGTELNEPLFHHMVESYSSKSHTADFKSYLITPSINSIRKRSLASSKVEHIKGTMSDFVAWLKSEFESVPTPLDVLWNVRPSIATMLSQADGIKEDKHIKILSSITPIHRSSLSLIQQNPSLSGVKEFYKGFKPTWQDIIENVPAILTSTENLYNIFESTPPPLSLYLVTGSAGCGKSTTLKQLALHLSESKNMNVYFIEEYTKILNKVVDELDERNSSSYYLFFDRIGDFASQISEIISKDKSFKVIFISAENPNNWIMRVKEHLSDKLTKQIDISKIVDQDADRILAKVEEYGNWTRLSKLSKKRRRFELLKRSKKQLLIGLMEATSGEGYIDLIKKEYSAIKNKSQRFLLILSGLATRERVVASESTLSRALDFLGLESNVYFLSGFLEGTLKYSNGNVTTRHKVYIDKLFERHVSQKDLHSAIVAYLKSFTVYDFPIAINISKSEMAIYKSLVNAKLLNKLFSGNETFILSIYELYEKDFEKEGLFLMQYGLALRTFSKDDEALEKLKIAHIAYPENPQVEHSLAHQKLIIACKTHDENYAMLLLAEAQAVLKRLDRAGIQIYDTYPITALSESHVQILDKFGQKESALIHAKIYFNQIDKTKNVLENERLQKTLAKLLKYTTTTKWVNS